MPSIPRLGLGFSRAEIFGLASSSLVFRLKTPWLKLLPILLSSFATKL